MKVERRAQLSVYLPNRVGALAEICRLIEQHRINLAGVSAVDAVEESVIRVVPQDPATARRVLEERGHRVLECEVLLADLPNREGATGRVAARLADRGINIDYLYASAHPDHDRAILILRTPQIDEAERELLDESL